MAAEVCRRYQRHVPDGGAICPPIEPTPPQEFILQIGQTFDSIQAAYEYYDMHSWHGGFGIRYGRNRTNLKRVRTRQDFVCSCAVSTCIFPCRTFINEKSQEDTSFRMNKQLCVIYSFHTFTGAWEYGNLFILS